MNELEIIAAQAEAEAKMKRRSVFSVFSNKVVELILVTFIVGLFSFFVSLFYWESYETIPNEIIIQFSFAGGVVGFFVGIFFMCAINIARIADTVKS
jgi:hypothetical protein